MYLPESLPCKENPFDLDLVQFLKILPPVLDSMDTCILPAVYWLEYGVCFVKGIVGIEN